LGEDVSEYVKLSPSSSLALRVIDADVSLFVVTLCDLATGGVFTAGCSTGGVVTALTFTVVIAVD
jgi:hypothetical protein